MDYEHVHNHYGHVHDHYGHVHDHYSYAHDHAYDLHEYAYQIYRGFMSLYEAKYERIHLLKDLLQQKQSYKLKIYLFIIYFLKKLHSLNKLKKLELLI